MSSFFETEAARDAFYRFPDIYEQAKKDWAKFKIGRAQGLFNAEQASEVLSWFRDFPRLWESLRPNWSENISETQRRFAAQVDSFVFDLKTAPTGLSGLGLAPVIIAGIIIVGGIASAMWAGGYIKKQMNISRMIEGVTAGRISESVLQEAVKDKPLFGDISGTIKWIVLGGIGLLVVLPALKARYER